MARDATARGVVREDVVRYYAARYAGSVADWCCRNIVFDEPENRGPFSLSGREYSRAWLEAWNDPTVSDLVVITGSQVGKTGSIMGGAAFRVVTAPARFFWVLPTRDTARKFSRTRLMALFRRSDVTRLLLPSGARRHDFATMEMQLGPSIVDLTWSNSPSALASVPASVVILDEMDKFDMGGTEANAVELAEQRTKDQAAPLRVKTSTPTVVDGLAWQELMKTDLRRRFMPCPHCGKKVLFAWSKEFTLLKLTGAEAFVKWDAEAKREEGWDLDRVARSARYECPFCHGHIRDGHKPQMDTAGEWQATAQSAAGYRGFHLPSLYACRPETGIGKLAVKFLQAKRSLLGLQGFINGDLAEPWESQETRGERIEVVSPDDAPPVPEAVLMLTVDVQMVSPLFWFVVRAWGRTGDSRLVDQGPLDAWAEVRAKQAEHSVSDNHVGIDSGHRAEEVYQECLRWGRLCSIPGTAPVWLGWTPMKGFDRREQWKGKDGAPRPWNLGSAALTHRRFRLGLIEFSTSHIADMLARLRAKKTKHAWEVTGKADERYWRHMDGELKKTMFSARTNRTTEEWVLRAKRWPNHMLDCERMQVACALFHHRLPWNEVEKP